MLSLWPPCADKRLGPAPALGTHPYSHSHPVLSTCCYYTATFDIFVTQIFVFILGVEIQECDSRIIFPPEFQDDSIKCNNTFDFTSLDLNTQEQLLDIIYQDTFTR